MYYGRKRKAPGKKGAKRSNRRRAPKRKSLVQTIKSVISRQAERKSWFDYASNIQIVGASNSLPVFRYLLPTVAQGTGFSGRIGSKISVKRAVIHGHVNILPYNASTNPNPIPIYVKMWLVSCKTINTNTLSSTPITSVFFDVVNTTVSFQGNMLDMEFTIDKQTWTLYAQKTIKLGAGYASSTGPTGTGGYYDNSPMSVPWSFNYTKHLKMLDFNESTNTPTNKNLFLIFQAVNADGTNSSGYSSAEFHYNTRIDYEDM